MNYANLEPFRLTERNLTKAAILQKTVATIIALLQALEGISIEHDTNADTDAELLRAIRRLWDDMIFQQRIKDSAECAAIINEVFVSFF